MKFDLNNRAFWLTLVCAAALTACGGGGGGSETSESAAPKPPETVVMPSSLTMSQAQVIVGRVGSVMGVAGTFSSMSRMLADGFNPFTQAQNTGGCETSGSVTRSQVDADGNRHLSVGDSLGWTAFNCQEPDMITSLPLTTDGSINATVLGASDMVMYGSSGNWNFRARQAYNAFTIRSGNIAIRLDGEADVEDKATEHSYKFLGIAQTSILTQNTIRLQSGLLSIKDESVGSAQRTVQFSDLVLRTNLSGSEMVDVTVPASSASSLFQNAAGVTSSGRLVLQLEKAQIIVTVLGANQVRIDVDNNNDGSIDATQTMAWSSVIAAAVL